MEGMRKDASCGFIIVVVLLLMIFILIGRGLKDKDDVTPISATTVVSVESDIPDIADVEIQDVADIKRVASNDVDLNAIADLAADFDTSSPQVETPISETASILVAEIESAADENIQAEKTEQINDIAALAATIADDNSTEQTTVVEKIRVEQQQLTQSVAITPQISEAAERVQEQTYIVEAGDSLSLISKDFYGTIKHWRKIASRNPQAIPNPNALRVGTKIIIPVIEEAAVRNVKPADTRAETAWTQSASEPRTYKVKSGDTLSRIARKMLGSSHKWRKIAEANDDLDPNSIRVGQVLKIPANE